MAKSKDINPKKCKKVSHYQRKINVDGEEWSWQCGYYQVDIKDPKGKKHSMNFSEFTGWDWNAIDRAIWKGSGIAIKPSHISKWIKCYKSKEKFVFKD